MSTDKGKSYFKRFGMEHRVLEFQQSSATVELAAKAAGVIPARIAKTLSFKSEEGCLLIVAAGDVRIDNKKFKKAFGIKSKMLTSQQVTEMVGYSIGGVCPFGISEDIPVYLDQSLKRFETVFPAVGSSNSAIELTIEELFKYSNAVGWVDVGTLNL